MCSSIYGSKIISGSFDETIRVWDASTGAEMLPPLRGPDEWIRSVAFSPDGSKIISGSSKTIRVWDISTAEEILPPLRGRNHFILSVAFSPDGSKIISQSLDEIIRVWDANTGILLPHPQMADEQMMGGWLTNLNTGRYMGALPVGVNFHSGQVRESTYVGWRADYKLVLVHFPEQ